MADIDDEFAIDEYNNNDNIQTTQQFNQTRTQHFDEALEISDHSQNDLTEASYDNNEQHTIQQQAYQRPASGLNRPNSSLQQQRPQSSRQVIQQQMDETEDNIEHNDSVDNDIAYTADETPSQATLYNYNDYAYLNQSVSKEVSDLFAYINRYTPQEIELPTPLRPFIPDYIPAVGEIDQFLKVLPPTGIAGVGECDTLGLTVLDEPTATQSDSNVLDLRLRVLSKNVVNTPLTVPSIENAVEHPKKIDKWIQSITQLHLDKPSTDIEYTHKMPSIDQLMEVWPTEIESLLQQANITLPTASIDMTPGEFSKVVCALLDIPVFKDKLIESLHLLFTLYQEFNQNAHFQSV